MCAFPRSLLAFTVLLLAASPARASSPADDDPGMGDGYRRLQESEQRYLFEQEARRQQGQGSVLQSVSNQVDDLAQNDAATGVMGMLVEAGAKCVTVLGQAGAKVLGCLPVDDISKVLGHWWGGDTDGAVRAYGIGWVGWLSGFIAGMAVESALAGTAVAVSAPAAVPLAAAAATIGVAYLAKRGFEALLDYGKAPPAPRAPRATPPTPALPPMDLPPGVRLTLSDEQIKNFLDNHFPPGDKGSASQTAALPPQPTPGAASGTLPVTPPVTTAPQPPAAEAKVPAPATPPPATATVPPTPPVATDAKPPLLDPKLFPPMTPPPPTPPVAKPQPLPPVTSPPVKPGLTTAQPGTTPRPPAQTKPAPPKPVVRTFAIYCVCCGYQMTLPVGKPVPGACPSCGRAKSRICGTNEDGERCVLGGGGWWWYKGRRTGLKPGQWFE